MGDVDRSKGKLLARQVYKSPIRCEDGDVVTTTTNLLTGETKMGKRIVQEHHCIYPSPDHPEQELTVRIFKGEHLVATRIQWYCRKSLSKGFIKYLKFFIACNEDRAEDL